MRFFHNSKDIANMKRGLNIDKMVIPMIRAEYKFQIFVKLITGKTITLDVRSSYAIERVEQLIHLHMWEDYNRNQVYLIFQGKILRPYFGDSYKLSDYKIQKNDTIRQKGRLRGGGKRARAAASEEAIPRFIGVPQAKDL